MIVVTGAAGFIGSCVAQHLYRLGYKDLVLVDDFSKTEKLSNLEALDGTQQVERDTFVDWLEEHHLSVQFIIHLGARTNTTEFDKSIFDRLNLEYSKAVWNHCVSFGLPLIYASSAATYGGGELGYEDNHEVVSQLAPLNPYGESKNEFDKWALQQERSPYFWVGLKFFNVYGPNEYHKGRMASVVLHAFKQLQQQGGVSLFRSHKDGYADGEQKRDFVYVKDVVSVIMHFMLNRKESFNGLYNLGTGRAQTFLDLANALFYALGKEPNISFIDTPEDIRDTYQYFTEANMSKLLTTGYDQGFMDLEAGVADYVQKHLNKDFGSF